MDDYFRFISNSTVSFVREEALSEITDAQFVLVNTVAILKTSSTFRNRVVSQLNQLFNTFKEASMGMLEKLKISIDQSLSRGNEIATRNLSLKHSASFNRLLFLITKVGKLYCRYSLTSETVWSVFLPIDNVLARESCIFTMFLENHVSVFVIAACKALNISVCLFLLLFVKFYSRFCLRSI